MTVWNELRRQPRLALSLRVRLPQGGWGVTRDLSEGGLYVLLPVQRWPEPWLAFELDSRRAGLRYRAYAQVLRMEPRPHAADGLLLGLALRLHEARLLPLQSLPQGGPPIARR